MATYIALLINILLLLTKNISAEDLVGLHQDDPQLIKIIKDKHLNFHQKGSTYNFTKNPNMKGQYGQAEAIEKLFKGKRNGFFVEAGAFDGENISNTLVFEMKYNWTGLLVEPNPDLYRDLITKNRRATSIETCFSTERKVVSIEFDAAGAYGGIIGHNKPGQMPTEKRDYKIKTNKNFKPDPVYHTYQRNTIKLECLPFTSIIMALGNPTIDYLSLDIEGAEYPVLKTIDFEKCDIKVISVENTKLGATFDGTDTQLRYHLQNNGYQLYQTVGEDVIYAKTEFLRQMNDEL